MALRRTTASAILFLVHECSGIRVNDLDAEEGLVEGTGLASDDSLFEDGDDGFKEMLTPLEVEVFAEVQDHLESHHESTDSAENSFSVKQIWAFRLMTKFVKEGKKKEAHMTCEEIQVDMLTVVQEAAQAIEPPSCNEEASPDCDYASWQASLDVDRLFAAQSKIIALASAADKKRCLPEAMPPPEATSNFLQLVLFVHESSAASTPEGKNRLQEAYLQLVSFQKGFVSHADGMADRKLLLSRDISSQSCPGACGLCDRRKSAAFGFRCLLKQESMASRVTDQSGVTCAEPTKRRLSWFRKYNYEMQCTVADWKQAAVQQVHISAAMSCASTVMTVGIRSELSPESRTGLYTACMGHQQSGEMDEASKKQYSEQLKQVDTVVSQTDKAVVGMVLALGQVSGLAALRAASRGNRAAQALLETDQDQAAATWDPSLFIEPFATHLLAEAADREEDREVAEAADREEDREDLAMYGDHRLLDRDAVMSRLEKSKAAQLQGTTDVVAAGTFPLALFAIENRGGAEDPTAVAANRGRTAMGGAGVLFVLLLMVAPLAFMIWMAHLITMGVLSLLTAAGAAKTILYVISFLFIGLPVSVYGFSRLFCWMAGGRYYKVEGTSWKQCRHSSGLHLWGPRS